MHLHALIQCHIRDCTKNKKGGKCAMTTAAQWIMNRYVLRHSWSRHRLLRSSGDAWKPQGRQTHSFSCGAIARTDYVSAAQQVFLNLLQVPQIHLRATNLRVHRSEQDWGAAQHRRAVLRTLLLTTCMIFKTIWLLFALCCGVGVWLCGGVSWCHLAALQKQNSVNDKEALYVKPGWLF